jgi:hypothetical protein
MTTQYHNKVNCFQETMKEDSTINHFKSCREGEGRGRVVKFNPPPHKSNVKLSNFLVQKKEKPFLACMSQEHSYIADISF